MDSLFRTFFDVAAFCDLHVLSTNSGLHSKLGVSGPCTIAFSYNGQTIGLIDHSKKEHSGFDMGAFYDPRDLHDLMLAVYLGARSGQKSVVMPPPTYQVNWMLNQISAK